MNNPAIIISIFSLALTSVGWFVTFWLNSRFQTRTRVSTLMNEERKVTTDALREFQDWCAEIQAVVNGHLINLETEKIPSLIESRKRRTFELSIDRRRIIWARRLEESAPLFPETVVIVGDMLETIGRSTDLAEIIIDPFNLGKTFDESNLGEFRAKITELIVLSVDLLNHILNVSLGSITGHVVPQRKPLNDSLILRLDKEGMLQVVKNKPRIK